MSKQDKPHRVTYQYRQCRVTIWVKRKEDATEIRETIGEGIMTAWEVDPETLDRDESDYEYQPYRVLIDMGDWEMVAWVRQRADSRILHEMVGSGRMEAEPIAHEKLAADIRETATGHER